MFFLLKHWHPFAISIKISFFLIFPSKYQHSFFSFYQNIDPPLFLSIKRIGLRIFFYQSILFYPSKYRLSFVSFYQNIDVPLFLFLKKIDILLYFSGRNNNFRLLILAKYQHFSIFPSKYRLSFVTFYQKNRHAFVFSIKISIFFDSKRISTFLLFLSHYRLCFVSFYKKSTILSFYQNMDCLLFFLSKWTVVLSPFTFSFKLRVNQSFQWRPT